ncbi:unnamed protein product [Polarella glacialis]|uniref:Secreted protein n=1 Tax=Polarella glacialis TaxID=89957 RepID=A0A813DE63_POLGL|nr:unnamed protein product [Polarella glacialis]
MAAVKLIKFVAVAILASSSAAEPTNRTCARQNQDEMVALQVGVQSHVGGCICDKVCPGYNCPGGTCKFSCSDAKKSYLASNPPGVDQEAFLRTECAYFKSNKRRISNQKCWASYSALTVKFQLPGPLYPCPDGFDTILSQKVCSIHYATSMNVVCPNGWCKCRLGGCGCKAQGNCR